MRFLSKFLGLFLISLMAMGVPALATAAEGPMKTDKSPYWYKPGSGPLVLPSDKFGSVADDVRMHNQKGIDSFLARKFEKALDHFEMANKLNPDNGILNYNQAIALHRLERHREAAVKFDEARKNANGNQLILKSPTLHAHMDMLE